MEFGTKDSSTVTFYHKHSIR